MFKWPQSSNARRPRLRPLPRPRPPNVFSLLLTVFRETQAPVASLDKEINESRYNLLTSLACTQQCHIDFAGISGIGTQGTLGRGDQAVVSQTRAILDTVFISRRQPRLSPLITKKATRRCVSRNLFEDLCAGTSEIRTHPNTVQLLAISWEIKDTRGWIWGSDLQVWPVMIFERAHHNDLCKFIESGEGKNLDIQKRRVQSIRYLCPT